MYKFPSKREVVTISLQSENTNSSIKSPEKSCTNICEIEQGIAKTSSEQLLENLLSNLIKYGVLIASTCVLLGGILYLVHHGHEPVEYQFFRGEPSQFRSPAGVVNAVFCGSSRGIIQLGLLLLIATPILRVIISLLTFIWRREFIYVMLTLLVLASLTYSLVGADY